MDYAWDAGRTIPDSKKVSNIWLQKVKRHQINYNTSCPVGPQGMDGKAWVQIVNRVFTPNKVCYQGPEFYSEVGEKKNEDAIPNLDESTSTYYYDPWASKKTRHRRKNKKTQNGGALEYNSQATMQEVDGTIKRSGACPYKS